MKKLSAFFLLVVCFAFSFSVVVKADDGNGHDAGYTCTVNIDCPPAEPQSKSVDPSNENDLSTSGNIASTFLEELVKLLPKG